MWSRRTSKRLLIALVWLLLGAAPTHAQVALVQMATDFTDPWETDAVASVMLPAPTTIGNTVLTCNALGASRTWTAAGDDGSGGSNTYAFTTESALQAGAGKTVISYGAIERVSQTVTTTINSALGGGAPGYFAVLEFSGLNVADLLEAQAQDVVAVAAMSHPTGPVSTLITHALLFGCLYGGTGAYDGTPTGFTEFIDQAQAVAAYKILTATTTNESWVPTSLANENSSSSIAAFNGTAASGCTGGILLLGAGKKC